ncbi:MAG: hypothetical protein JW990_12665, partial [Thermoleophilia bacterium]|nr:hypothetical protein [Thermoleophilia bacterium]
MGKKLLLFVMVTVLMVFGLATAALAATPQDIYDDYTGADGSAVGSLEGTYTDAELQAYLDDPLIDQYGDPTVVGELDALVTSMLEDGQDEFPMTGAELT